METHEIKTVSGEFDNYMDKSYAGQTVSDHQRVECYKAFFAGAATLLLKMNETANLPTPVALVVIEMLRAEILDTLKNLAGEVADEEPKKPSNN